MINSFSSYDIPDNMATVQTMDKVQTALCHITGNRAGGGSEILAAEILPKVAKVCLDTLIKCLAK